ncbi:TPM domain-containing protein [Sphingomonas sp. TREG-RG-20F-R18-01]|uniref:TPM domain-containing protein n=1 Tax=Sphingomonas sp. TREG-RG-20F-R18-01 TaxID=2914982 RepID=UPI001F5AEEE4|nr:TPM domain-containing protein [Sphingomonas sp. TREG-RG-20F-R18-01]
MARTPRLTPDDHARVLAAVEAAEHGTDGEIVTIVTERSDSYHDAALQVAILAMLLVVALAAVDPLRIELWLSGFTQGWDAAPDPRLLLGALLVVETLVFLLVRLALSYMPLRLALVPKATRRRRVRRRAIQYFKVGAERRTEARVGILLYLSRDERMAEIVADEGIHRAVPAERWGDAMAALVHETRDGRPGAGMAAAVERIGAILSESFPKTETDRNELPDRLIEL